MRISYIYVYIVYMCCKAPLGNGFDVINSYCALSLKRGRVRVTNLHESSHDTYVFASQLDNCTYRQLLSRPRLHDVRRPRGDIIYTHVYVLNSLSHSMRVALPQANISTRGNIVILTNIFVISCVSALLCI